MQTIPATEISNITHLSGRWTIKQIQNDDVLYTPLLGGRIAFTISNATKMTLNALNNAGPVSESQYWAYRIDKGDWHRFTAQPIHLTLPNESQEVEFITAGNSDMDNVWNGDQGFVVASIETDDDAVITPFKSDSQLLVLGDSITAGCWVNGKHASKDYRAESNYVGIADDLVTPEIVRVAYSGSGIIRPATGNVPPAPEWLTKLDQDTPAQVGNYQFVIVNLGVNDRIFNGLKFQQAYQEYVQVVQQRYGVPVMLMIPFWQSFADEIRAVGQKLNCHVIETANWHPLTTDGLHPNQVGSIRAGKLFADVINDLLRK